MVISDKLPIKRIQRVNLKINKSDCEAQNSNGALDALISMDCAKTYSLKNHQLKGQEGSYYARKSSSAEIGCKR